MPVGREPPASVRVPVAGTARHCRRRAAPFVSRIMSRWGDEKTLFFISCYKNHECLWNPTSFFYKSKTARANAYCSLLEQFNDDNMTVQLLKTKIKNIRTTYHQELNKIRYSKLSGADKEYKPTLCWFDALDQFLGETVQKESTTKLCPQTSTKFNNFKRKLQTSSNLDINTSAQTDANKPQPTADAQEPIAKKKINIATNKLLRQQEDETESEKSADTPNRFDITPSIVNPPGPFQDEFHFFGMNVAAQLRKLPLHAALQIQTEFQSTLYLARVQSRISPAGEDMEDTTHTFEVVSEVESVEQDVDSKEFPLDVKGTVECQE